MTIQSSPEEHSRLQQPLSTKAPSELTKQVKEGLDTNALTAEPQITKGTLASPLPPLSPPMATAVGVALAVGPPRVELTAEEFMRMAKAGEPLPENATVTGNVRLPKWDKPLPAGLHVILGRGT